MNLAPRDVVEHKALGVWGQLLMLLTCFRKWPTVTARPAASRLLRQLPSGRPPSLRARAGPVLTASPADGARCTVVEVFGRDEYQLGAFQIHAQATVFGDIGDTIGAVALNVCSPGPARGSCASSRHLEPFHMSCLYLRPTGTPPESTSSPRPPPANPGRRSYVCSSANRTRGPVRRSTLPLMHERVRPDAGCGRRRLASTKSPPALEEEFIL